MGKIIDFNRIDNNHDNDASPDTAVLFPFAIPKNALMQKVDGPLAERMSKLGLVIKLTEDAHALIKEAGFDPSLFDFDVASLDNFLRTSLKNADPEDLAPEIMWNGPRFCLESRSTEVRLASTVFLCEEGHIGYIVDLLKHEANSKQWQIWSEKEWITGPSVDFLTDLDALHSGFLDDDWFEDDDEEEWESSVESMLLPTNIITTLLKAGIDRIDELAKMSDAELLAIHGIGKKSLKEIREALEFEDVDD